MKFFDVNLSTGRWPFRDLPLENMEAMKVKLEVSGISGGLVRSLEAPFSMNIYEANEKLLKNCVDFPEFIPVPAVRPDFGLWREITARAVVLYPGYHQYALLDEACIEMISELTAKNIVPVIPIREEDERGQHPLCKIPPVPASDINKLAEKFPGKPFIVLNCYSYEFAELTAKNVYADIAFADGFPALGKTLKNIEPKRLLFGTHAPFFCISAVFSKLQHDDLTEEDIANIAFNNIKGIFDGQ